MQGPFARILAAVMRGNAEVQGQTQAKKVASDQMDANAKTKLTMEATPNGGPPLVTFKGPADLLNQTQDSDVEKAYSTPKINVEEAIRARGGVPRDVDIVNRPEKLDQYSERYRARRDLGGSVIKSAIMAGLAGSRTDPKLRENLQRQNFRSNSAEFQKFVKPVMDEEQDEADLQLRGANYENTVATQGRMQRKEYFDRLNKVVDDTPFETIDESQWVPAVEEQFGQKVPESVVSSITRRGQLRVGKALDAFMNKDADALGQFKTLEDAKRAFGRALSPAQQKRLEANWQAARGKVRKAEDATAAREVREDMATAAAARAAAASERAARNEDRSITNQERRRREDEIDNILSTIDRNIETMRKNALDLTKVGSDAERAELWKQNRELRVETQKAREQLDFALGKKFTPEIERGIEAYMAATKADRPRAIKELRASGRIR